MISSNPQVFEQNREEFLQAYKDHKDEFISLITKINECYKKIIDDNKWGSYTIHSWLLGYLDNREIPITTNFT